ncbi:MAG: hypothetical protein Ta2D_04520 [Rickettsiales bacterium]|nr:MAG: hypothetical protein Ta2D_04520 [Rickettsiales bacterium]
MYMKKELFLLLFLCNCVLHQYTETDKKFVIELKNFYTTYSDMKRAKYDYEFTKILDHKVYLLNKNEVIELEKTTTDDSDMTLSYRSAEKVEIESYRERAYYILENTITKKDFPLEAARLQFSFDCWALEETYYTKFSQMVRCKKTFLDTLSFFEFKLANVIDTKVEILQVKRDILPPKQQTAFYIYFGFDSSSLDERGSRDMWKILDYLDKLKTAWEVRIYGHTDRVGTLKYNEKLSDRRIRTVRHYLIKNGVPEGKIKRTYSQGEEVPTVLTNDNEKAFLNRRVGVIIDEMPLN